MKGTAGAFGGGGGGGLSSRRTSLSEYKFDRKHSTFGCRIRLEKTSDSGSGSGSVGGGLGKLFGEGNIGGGGSGGKLGKGISCGLDTGETKSITSISSVSTT